MAPDMAPGATSGQLPHDSRSTPVMTSGWGTLGPRQALPGAEVGREPVVECCGVHWELFRSEFSILPDIEFGEFWKVRYPRIPKLSKTSVSHFLIIEKA